MKKRFALTFSTLLLTIVMLLCVFTPTIIGKNYLAEPTSYSLVLNKDKNRFQSISDLYPISGTAVAQTELGNNVNFKYSRLLSSWDNSWQLLLYGSYFYNIDPLNNLQSIQITTEYTECFTIYWSDEPVFDESKCQIFNYTSDTTCYFGGDSPKHVKVVFTRNTTDACSITSVVYKYGCVPDDRYQLNISSEDTSKGTVSGDSGLIRAGTEVTVSATPNQDYAFEGWYFNSEKVSSDASYTFNMPNKDYSLVAKFANSEYNVNVLSNDETKGTVSGGGTYPYLSNVTLSASPSTGSFFVGWFDGDELISEEPVYEFDMPNRDLNYVGKFENVTKTYLLLVTCEDITRGTVYGSGYYSYQEEVQLQAIPSEGYTFFGWFKNGELLSKETSYTYIMPLEDTTIFGRFVKLYNLSIEVNDDDAGSVIYPLVVGAGSFVEVKAIPNSGYAFSHWGCKTIENLDQELSFKFIMPPMDVVLYANFVNGGHKVNVHYNPEDGIISGDYNYLEGQTVILSATPIRGLSFKGWYSDNEYVKLLSSEFIYTFTMADSDVDIYAKFMSEEEWKIAHGIIPCIHGDNTKLTYGLYPQKHVNNPLLIECLNELDDSYIDPDNGWYLYNEEYYAKAYGNPFQMIYSFSDRTNIVKNEKYWFKCEPIEWKILSNDSGKCYILSDVLLDTKRYDDSENNYKNSEIRSWLNDEFYKHAFGLNDSYVLPTVVDNSASTTSTADNPYVCENTSDKVFMPSFKDYLNPAYGFDATYNKSSTRVCKLTDWAKVNNARACTETLDIGHYWTRSPDYVDYFFADYVDEIGRICAANVVVSSKCVRPAITIAFNIEPISTENDFGSIYEGYYIF